MNLTNSQKFYNGDKLLSRDKLFNFVIGARSAGKTYFYKRLCVRRFLKTGKQFVWVRRYKSEMNKAKTEFFSDISNLFENKIEVKGNKVYIDDKVAGHFITLSISSSFKSVPFPLVTTIVFDEFIIDKSTFRYLRDEVSVFLELYSTIARPAARPDCNDVKCIFIGNAISFVNPYFLYFGIKNTGKEFFEKNEICVQHYVNKNFVDEVNKTKFASLIKGTEYYNYSVENAYVKDSKIFIQSKTAEAYFRCAFYYKGRYFGCWLDWNKGKIFIDESYEKQSSRIFTVLNEDHMPNTIMIRGIKNNFTRELKLCFAEGNLRFSNQVVKQLFFEILSLLT